MTDQEIIRFARDMLSAAEAGDYAALREFYTPDAKLWMNTSQTWKTLDEHFATATEVRTKLQKIRYTEARIIPFEDGYVQQFRSQADIEGDGRVDIPVCLVVRLRDGKICQREEYLDSAALQALTGRG